MVLFLFHDCGVVWSTSSVHLRSPARIGHDPVAKENHYKLTPPPQVFAPILSSRLLDDPLKVIAGNELENLTIHAACCGHVGLPSDRSQCMGQFTATVYFWPAQGHILFWRKNEYNTLSRNDAPLGKSLVGEEKLPRMGLPSKCVFRFFPLVFEPRQR
jgi:hypothetical protein